MKQSDKLAILLFFVDLASVVSLGAFLYFFTQAVLEAVK